MDFKNVGGVVRRVGDIFPTAMIHNQKHDPCNGSGSIGSGRVNVLLFKDLTLMSADPLQLTSRNLTPSSPTKTESSRANSMAGLVTFSMAGVGFLLLSVLSLHRNPKPFHLSSALLSSLFILYSILTLFFSSSADPIGSPLPLSVLSASSLFLLHSLSSFLVIPKTLLSLLELSAFSVEILLLSLRRRDPSGIESRYFSLLLVPASALALSALASISFPRSSAPRLSRAAALALHGTWLIQMSVSIFSHSFIAHGCFLKQQSWANYTVKCKGHMEYHRGRAIATLQFNCHLALILVVGIVVYAFVVGRSGSGVKIGGGYRPIGKEVQMMGAGNGGAHFVLDSDDEDEEAAKAVPISISEMTLNGGSR